MERLNKFLAHAGVGSRRHCDELIAAGRVKVNGRKVADLGLKIDPVAHDVAVDDHPVKTEKHVYWAVNKPIGYLCTNDDPAGRPRAVELLPHVAQRVYTVGRLDEASEGLLVMTNDGELANALTHPRYSIPKTYLVLVAGKPGPEDIQKLLDGVWLSEGKVRASDVRRLKPQGDSTWLRIVLTEGKNREIRRMLAQQGHKVLKLRRVAIGPVKLDKLPRGKARRVSEPELAELRRWVALATERIAKLKDKPAATPGPAGAKPAPGFRPAAGPRPAGPKPARPYHAGPKPRPAGPLPARAYPAGAKPAPGPNPAAAAGPRPAGPKTAHAYPAGPKPGRPYPAGPKPGRGNPDAGRAPAGAGKPRPYGPKPGPDGLKPRPAGPRPGPARTPARPKGWKPLPKSR